MFTGKLTAIYVGPASNQPMNRVASVKAIAGEGLEADRYATGVGTFAKPGVPDRELTLIESEAIDAAAGEYKFELTAEETRRNLITEGVPLNHLVGKEFSVGEVRLRGIRLCEPCGHLEKQLNKPVEKALRHRGGLRAQVLTSGTINEGDEVTVAE